VLTLGNYGRKGPEGVSPVSLKIVGNVYFENGANANGLEYTGPEMDYLSSAIELLGMATYD